jgi:hypothetical protein
MDETQNKVISLLLIDAVNTDGAHHKQWYIEKIAAVMGVELPPHEEGRAP